jgi:DNA-binding CsgD family transcriptional regulator
MGIALHKLHALARASSEDELRRRVSRIVQHLGVEFWVYALNLPLVDDRRQQFTLIDYPAAWVGRYIEAGYMQVDPTVAHCQARSTPFVWADAQARVVAAVDPMHGRVRRMFGEASEAGLGVGVSIPLHGPGACWGLMSFAGAWAARPVFDRRLPELTLIAHFVHEAARPFARSAGAASRPPDLTLRERECLHWAAEGKSSWEIGQVLGCSERTVIFHLQNAARKLGVGGRQAAVARAVSLGVVAVG